MDELSRPATLAFILYGRFGVLAQTEFTLGLTGPVVITIIGNMVGHLGQLLTHLSVWKVRISKDHDVCSSQLCRHAYPRGPPRGPQVQRHLTPWTLSLCLYVLVFVCLFARVPACSHAVNQHTST